MRARDRSSMRAEMMADGLPAHFSDAWIRLTPSTACPPAKGVTSCTVKGSTMGCTHGPRRHHNRLDAHAIIKSVREGDWGPQGTKLH